MPSTVVSVVMEVCVVSLSLMAAGAVDDSCIASRLFLDAFCNGILVSRVRGALAWCAKHGMSETAKAVSCTVSSVPMQHSEHWCMPHGRHVISNHMTSAYDICIQQ